MSRLSRTHLTGFPVGVILENCTEVFLSVRRLYSQNMSDEDQYYHLDLVDKLLFSFEIFETYSTQISLYSRKDMQRLFGRLSSSDIR